LMYRERMVLLAFTAAFSVVWSYVAYRDVVLALFSAAVLFSSYFPFVWLAKRRYITRLCLREKAVVALVSLVENSGWCAGFAVGIGKRILKSGKGETVDLGGLPT
jgi:hypothetical protein